MSGDPRSAAFALRGAGVGNRSRRMHPEPVEGSFVLISASSSASGFAASQLLSILSEGGLPRVSGDPSSA